MLKGKSLFSSNILRSLYKINTRLSFDRVRKFQAVMFNKKYFSSAVSMEENPYEGKFFNTYKIIRNRLTSIYDTVKIEKAIQTEADIEEQTDIVKSTSPKIDSLFNIDEVTQNVSKFLKSIELAREYDIKLSKLLEVKKYIPILNKDDVRGALSKLLSDPKISQRNLNDLHSLVSEQLKISQSYESVFDETYYNNLTNLLLEIGKFFLSNNIYYPDHTVNTKIKFNKDCALELADIKTVLEFISFSELSDDQLIRIFPVMILLNNVYVVNEIVMEKLFSETLKRIFNPIKGKENDNTKAIKELLRSYLMFIIVNNFVSNSKFYLRNLIVYKDIILKNNDINDLVYLLTENIFKFINIQKSNKSLDFNDQILLFDEFLNSYMRSFSLIEKANRLNINEDLLQHFLYSLIILNDFNSSLEKSNQFLSQYLLQVIRSFINEGIFNLDSEGEKILANQNIVAILNKESTVQSLIEIENKLLNQIEDKLFADNSVLNLYSGELLKEVTFDQAKNIILNAGNEKNFNHFSAKKGIVQLLALKFFDQIADKKLKIEEIGSYIDSCGKYALKETKLIYNLLKVQINSQIKSAHMKTLSDLLYSKVKYNLIDIYENDPMYIQFLLNFNEESFTQLVKQTPKILWTLSNFALRTKEFNPVYLFIINNLNIYLTETILINNKIPTDDIRLILQSLQVIELMMKYNLTNVDFRDTFSKDLISSLLTLYLNRFDLEEDLSSKLKYNLFYNFIQSIFGEEAKEIVKSGHTNLDFSIIFKFRNMEVPLILVSEEDFNIDGKLMGDIYIQYQHLKSYFNGPPLILNVDKMKKREDLEREFASYRNAPKTVYKKNLE